MKKLIKLLTIMILTLMPYNSASAQTFEYEGSYLTQDHRQVIQGFHFDLENEQIYIILKHSYAKDLGELSNSQRLTNIDTYIESHYDFESLSQEEMAAFNDQHGIDYAAALENIIASDTEIEQNWETLLDVQLPGIYRINHLEFEAENADGYSQQTVLINQPKISFNQNMWDISMFDIRTPVLRFQGSSDTDSITDDFGVTYEKTDEDLMGLN